MLVWSRAFHRDRLHSRKQEKGGSRLRGSERETPEEVVKFDDEEK